MKIKELLEFCQICPFCQDPMPLTLKYLRQDRKTNVSNGIFSFIVTGIGQLEIDLEKNFWKTPNRNETTHINLNNRNFSAGRKCACPAQTTFQAPLNFEEAGNIPDIKISSLMFEQAIGKDKMVIHSDYKNEYTSVSKYNLTNMYYTRNELFHRQLPLINFDFSSREKIEEKLKMIMTFL